MDGYASIKGVLYPLLKISMFYVLSQKWSTPFFKNNIPIF